ncbi:PKD domain-containing protein [Pontibacter brevis]
MQWDKTYGGNNDDLLTSSQQTVDGGYILGGYSYSNAGGDKSTDEVVRGGADYWVVKLDALGNKQWDKTFGGNDNDFLQSLQQTVDGGYVLGGYSYSNAGGDKSADDVVRGGADYWVVKLDALGNKEWDKTIGGAGEDFMFAIQQTNDQGFILGGHSKSNISGDKSANGRGGEDYWVVKLDVSGNKLWDKTIGGNSGDFLRDLEQTTDGGYILGGYSYSSNSSHKSEPLRGNADYWVVKLDASGIKQWDKTFGGSDIDHLRSLKQTADEGYILGGYSKSNKGGEKSEDSKGSYDYWVIKLDGSGSMQWDRTIGGSSFEDLFTLQQTIEGGYLVGGYTNSGKSAEGSGGDKSEPSKGLHDCWIVKLNASGSKQWDKTIGGSKNDYVRSLQLTVDGGYFLGGYSYSNKSGDKSEDSKGGADYWVVKLMDPVTCVDPVASFTAAPVCLSTATAFIDASSNVTDGAAYAWDVDNDGTTDYTTKGDITHTYATAGNYTAKLTITQGSCMHIYTSQVTVGSFAEALITAVDGGDPNMTVPVSSETQYMISSAGASTYSWSLKNSSGTLITTGITGASTNTLTVTWPTTPDVYTLSVTYGNGEICPDRSVFIYIAVYDPSAGFVTGGGWINSLPNTALQYMQEGGKAHFAFESKYKKGSTTVVDGKTVFKFQVGGMDFRSTSHDDERLVISGKKANYKGKGTINGEGNYGFLLSAVDGQYNGGTEPDKLRMKIWDAISGVVVYDNQHGEGDDAEASTLLGDAGQGGGSIVIHNPNLKSSSTKAVIAIEILAPTSSNFYSYPTAFSDRATVAFSLEKEEVYVLEVYDMKGALVKKIANGLAEANRLYEFELRGDGMASGIFIARLTTTSTVRSLKMVLKR